MYKKLNNCSTEKKKKTNKSPVRPGKILQTNDHMGKSVPGKMFMTRGFELETPALVEILPIYTKCTSCQMFLGSKEIDLANVLNENCVECFEVQIEEEGSANSMMITPLVVSKNIRRKK